MNRLSYVLLWGALATSSLVAAPAVVECEVSVPATPSFVVVHSVKDAKTIIRPSVKGEDVSVVKFIPASTVWMPGYEMGIEFKRLGGIDLDFANKEGRIFSGEITPDSTLFFYDPKERAPIQINCKLSTTTIPLNSTRPLKKP